MEKSRIIGLAIIVLFIGAIVYFFWSSETAKTEIPSYVTGEKRAMYEWAKTPEGIALLDQVPCYCGCKYEGHHNAEDCFWRDNGNFDKHGISCSTCLDIAKKTKAMNEEGKNICEIVKAIDEFYKPNANLRTDTPLPEGCTE